MFPFSSSCLKLKRMLTAVNNAGIVSGSTVLDTPDNKIIKTFEVNALAHFWTIKVEIEGVSEELKRIKKRREKKKERERECLRSQP